MDNYEKYCAIHNLNLNAYSNPVKKIFWICEKCLIYNKNNEDFCRICGGDRKTHAGYSKKSKKKSKKKTKKKSKKKD